MVEEWLTTTESARLSEYYPAYIRDLLCEGKIGGRKFGTVWQVSRRSLLAYMQEMQDKGERGDQNHAKMTLHNLKVM